MQHLTHNHHLDSLIAQAWNEIQQDPQHRLRVATRFDLYDQLTGDMGVTMREVAKTRTGIFPQVTPGLKRFWYLGLHTVRPLLAIWDQAMAPWLAANPDYDPDWSFPEDILTVTDELLRGIPYVQVEAAFVDKSKYGGDINAWHGMVGELDEIGLPETAMLCLEAIYAFHCSVCGSVPIEQPITDDTYDAPYLYHHTFNDWTAYACAAIVSHTTAFSDQSEQRSAHDARAALEFWRWWLFESLPEAASIDLDALGWEIVEFANVE